jgi:hypothetical protein
MMELLFNTAWFVVVVAAIAALLRSEHRKAVPVQLWLALGALVCAALILFPSISVSDDLHIDAFLVEDSNSTKRLTKSTLANSVSPLFWCAIAFSAFQLFAHRRHCSAVVERRSSSYRDPLFNRDLLGRAPPNSAC